MNIQPPTPDGGAVTREGGIKGVSSMTGFARVDGGTGGVSWAWEARSVNGRGLDVRVRLPQGVNLGPDPWDTWVREAMRAVLNRGAVNVQLHVRTAGLDAGLRINHSRLRAYAYEARRLARAGLAQPASADGLLALRGVVEAGGGDDPALLRAENRTAMRADLNVAAQALADDRAREGRALADVLGEHLNTLEQLHRDASALAQDAPAQLRRRLAGRLSELLQDSVSEDRLAQEAAVLAVKADVGEELDRLRAHIGEARMLLAQGGSIGRKLDFLSQEFMREANTLGAKSADMALTRVGLALKAVVDQFREQAQNVA